MPARLERLRFAALMHDIGKLVVPNQLLNKPGRLTAEEFAQVRIHEKVSVQMLTHIDFLRPIAAAAHSDNTRFDPDDPDHPIEPYIVMIADAYDAMTSTRAYRKALSQDVAFQELRDKAGVQFHPECVEALIRALEAKGEHHGAGFEGETEFDERARRRAGFGRSGRPAAQRVRVTGPTGTQQPSDQALRLTDSPFVAPKVCREHRNEPTPAGPDRVPRGHRRGRDRPLRRGRHPDRLAGVPRDRPRARRTARPAARGRQRDPAVVLVTGRARVVVHVPAVRDARCSSPSSSRWSCGSANGRPAGGSRSSPNASRSPALPTARIS